MRLTPYWRHALSRYKLRGDYVTWCLTIRNGWLRIGSRIFRWGTPCKH
jgi:hypothetical protein